MFIVRGGRRVPFVLEGDAGGGGGGDDFDQVMDGVAAKYADGGDGATGAASAEGTGAEPGIADPSAPVTPPAAEPPAPSVPDPALVTDDIPYRDAVRLREEMARARDTYKPIEEALADIGDEDRSTLLAALPNLHPDDRSALIDSMRMLASDDPEQVEEAAAFFVRVAEHLRSGDEPDTSAVDRDPDLLAGDPMDQPMTRREHEAWAAEQRQEAEVARQTEGILSEARELGYDPEATDPAAIGEFAALCEIARRTDGDLTKAHGVLQQRRQAVIDEYVASKQADAARTPSPTGGASSTEERTLDTLDDAEAAMRARMEATLGPRN